MKRSNGSVPKEKLSRSIPALFEMTQTKDGLKKMTDDDLMFMRTTMFKLSEDCTVELLKRIDKVGKRLDKVMSKR